MATPPRLVRLQCPECKADHWEIDHDYRGIDPEDEIPYAARAYRCPNCAKTGCGYEVTEKSPPAFFLQPHPMYPMNTRDFNHWVTVLRENFPDHPLLRELGKRWYAFGGE